MGSFTDIWSQLLLVCGSVGIHYRGGAVGGGAVDGGSTIQQTSIYYHINHYTLFPLHPLFMNLEFRGTIAHMYKKCDVEIFSNLVLT